MAQPVSCCLPKFGTSTHGPRRPASLRIRTSPSQTLQLLAAWDQSELDSLLKATWALLLHRYTGLEDICFGYQPIGVDAGPRDTLPSFDTHNNIPLTFNLTITEDDSVHAILRNTKQQNDAEKCGNSSSSCHSYTLCNTLLMLRNCRSVTKDPRAPLVQPALAIPLPEKVGDFPRSLASSHFPFAPSPLPPSHLRSCALLSAHRCRWPWPFSPDWLTSL